MTDLPATFRAFVVDKPAGGAFTRGLRDRTPSDLPDGEVTDQPETFLAAELVREQLLRVAREELPHSIAVVVEPLDEDREPEPGGTLRLLAVIRVERESQKGIVIGKGGAVLKEAGTNARHELEALLGVPVYLETRVKVELGQRKGRIVVEFGSMDDLDRIVGLMSPES